MSIPKILKKRKCSFKPTSTVRALLTELDSLLSLLEKDATVEDFINEALQIYLPETIITFRQELHNKNKIEKILNNISEKINNFYVKNNESLEIETEKNDVEDDTYTENINVVNLKDRLPFQ